MQLKKICPVCGINLIDASQSCCDRCAAKRNIRHKDYDIFRRDKKAKAFYHSREWVRLANSIKASRGGYDQYAYAVKHKLITDKLCVHHIIELSEGWSLRLEPDNLIVVSESSHNEIHKAYRTGVREKNEMQDTLIRILDDKKLQLSTP